MLFTKEDKTFIKIFVPDYGLWTTETYDRVQGRIKTRLGLMLLLRKGPIFYTKRSKTLACDTNCP